MKKQLKITVYTDSGNCEDSTDTKIYSSEIENAVKNYFNEYDLSLEIELNEYDPEEEGTIKEDLQYILKDAWEVACNGE